MRLLSCFLALAISTSAALAGDVGPLSPGAPAGVKRAQLGEHTVLYALLGVGAVVGIAVGVSSGGYVAPPNPGTTTTTTTTTTTA